MYPTNAHVPNIMYPTPTPPNILLRIYGTSNAYKVLGEIITCCYLWDSYVGLLFLFERPFETIFSLYLI